MISIWDMVVGSGYPEDHAYIGIGMGVFVLSFLIALMTLPLLIYLIERYYTQLLKLTRRGGGRLDRSRNYEYDYYRIIIFFLFGACILILLIIVMSTHGLYFMYKICIYINDLREIDHELQKNRLTYVIPSTHYVLYFLEAAYEAAEENLILWGFLFLVNFICTLTVKQFYFKIFTMVLSIRVVFVFACHFNTWEYLVNRVYDDSVKEEIRSNIKSLAMAMYPFHTIPKALRVLEIMCSLIVFIPFALYIRRLIAQKLVECNLRDENNRPEERTLLRGYHLGLINAKEKVEIEFAKKYLCGYTLFLVIHLILNILDCHFIVLIVYEITHNGNNAVLAVEMVTSVITDILAFAPSFLFLLFITYFVYSTTKVVRQVVRQDGETEQHQKYRYKRYRLTGLIILFCSLFCTGFIGYLRFTDGDSILIHLKNYDYILFNESRKTDLSKFIDSCDQVDFSDYSQNQLTIFDSLTLYYDPVEGNLTDINFYEDYDEIPSYINENITSGLPNFSTRMWFPANTCLHDIKVEGDNSINYTLTPIPYPCYYTHEKGSVNYGLRIMCSEYEEREKQATILFCTTNTSNNCCIPNDSMITTNGLAAHSFTANRPRYKGKNATNNLQPKIQKNFLIEFIQPQVNVNIGERESRIFFMTCVHNYWWATGILLLIFIIMGMYLSLCFVCLSKLLSSCFV